MFLSMRAEKALIACEVDSAMAPAAVACFEKLYALRPSALFASVRSSQWEADIISWM